MGLDELYKLSRHYLTIKYKPYHRNCVDESYFKHRLSVLIGQRGVGKTTVLIQYLLDYAKNDAFNSRILYIPSDHFLLGNLSLYEIAEQFSLFGGELLVFDEIHKYIPWVKELKSIYDTFPNLKVIASGSSALEIRKGSYDLTRRAAVSYLPGLSFREYLGLHWQLSLPPYHLEDIINHHEKIVQEVLSILGAQGKKVLYEFNRYLRIGYYPYFLEIHDPNIYFLTLEQNFHAILEADLTAIHPLLTSSSIRKMKKLLVFIAANVPFTPNMSKLSNLLDIGDERTLKTYFKYLEDVELIRLAPGSSKKLHKIEIPEKIYLNNTNQMYAIANMQNIGTIREIFFLSMLAKKHEVTVPKYGDFLINDNFTFEIGGKNKNFEQIKNISNAYLACDGIEYGINQTIPLWLFGFLY